MTTCILSSKTISGGGPTLNELEKILKKDPIINTKHASDLVDTPNNVENYYKTHAATHMPIKNTDEYFEQICNWITKNKSALVGGVVGGYGLGKTSLMVYFWHRAQEDKFLAIPPYSWDTIQDHINAAHAWTRYYFVSVLGVGQPVMKELSSLYESFKEKSIESEAQKLASESDIPLEKARTILRSHLKSGKYSLDYTENDLLDFYEKLTQIAKNAGLKGLLIFTDELQQTADSGKRPFKEVASTLFRIVNGIGGREGDYGMFFGMPQTFQVRLSKERKDILDRMQKQKCFIDLSDMYDINFPTDLWNSYVESFGLGEISETVVSNETLVSIGQVCDSRRPDLGNGPRSVISAFNMMVSHFKKHNSPYEPTDFVNDCLKNEIVLGDSSEFVRKTRDLLAQEFVKGKWEDVVRFLAAFPEGTTAELERAYHMDASIKDMIRDSGGLGKVIAPSPGNGHSLVEFRSKKVEPENELKVNLRSFYNEYSPDRHHIHNAMDFFMRGVIKRIFRDRTQTEVVGWIAEQENWDPTEWGFQIVLRGTFENSLSYPQRRIRLEVTGPQTGSPPDPELRESDVEYRGGRDPIDFVFRFNLDWNADNDQNYGSIEFKKWPSRIVTVNVNPFYWEDHRTMDQIHETIQKRECTPFLYMNLSHYMETVDLGSEAKQQWDAIAEDVSRIAINTLLNEKLLDVKGADVQLDNKGARLIEDLFGAMCKANFPDYHTIIKSRMAEKKLNEYKEALANQDLSLSVKRGREPLRFMSENGMFDVKASKTQIAKLFSLKTMASFDEWIAELGPLVDTSKWDEGEILLKLHPIEEEILGRLENSRRTKEFNGKECKCIDGKPILKEMMAKGYRYEELKTIIEEIGPSRRLFTIDLSTGLLCRPPETLEDVKKAIQETVDKLKSDVRLLEEKCKEFQLTSLREIFKQTESVNDEESAERITALLKRERAGIDSFMTNLLVRMQGELEAKLHIVELDVKQQDARATRILSADPVSTAKWIHQFGTIKKTVTKSYADFKGSLTGLSRDVAGVAKEASDFKAAHEPRSVSDFLKIYGRISDLKSKTETDAVAEANVIFRKITQIDEWIKLSSLYKLTYEKVTYIEQNLGDPSLLKEYESVSQELSNFLSDEGENALKDWEAQKNRIDAVNAKAANLMNNLRSSFNEQKKSLSEELKIATGSESLIRTTFDETNVQSAYKSMGDECYSILNTNVTELENQLREIGVDVQYSKSILALAKDVADLGLEKEVASSLEKIRAAKSRLSAELLSKPENKEKVHEVCSALNDARLGVGATRAKLRKIQVAKEVSADSKLLLDVISKVPQRNLKDVIVEMAAKKDMDLDSTLNQMKECFKAGQIEVILKRKQ